MSDSIAAQPPLAHCALLFALPLTREALVSAMVGDELRDYGAQLAGRGEGPEEVWRERFSSIAADGVALADFAEVHGAYVCRRATLAEIARATRDCRVIILFAHLWSAAYQARNLRDVAAIRQRLAGNAGPVARAIRLPATNDPELAAEALNDVIEPPAIALLPEGLQPAARASHAIGTALCRDLLDTCLDGLVEPGNRIELYDGPCAPGRFVAAIDSGFVGEMDLSLCNSSIVATMVELRFDTRVRMASRTTLTVPHPEFRLTFAALRRVVQGSSSYLGARREIAQDLRRHENGR